MKVTLISYTPDALELLLFTKNTRLAVSPTGLDEVRGWSAERKAKELAYMLGTIQSSWEFVEYTFVIEEVTRAFTHQAVRHRVGVSFAQQAQRVVDMTGFKYMRPGGEITEAGHRNPGEMLGQLLDPAMVYDEAMTDIAESYAHLRALGVNPQDARGVLPTNIATNIVWKINLRALHEMLAKRLCVKAQGEFQNVARLMRESVIAVHPWAEPFLRVGCAFHGVCIFPGVPVDQCHVKPHVFNPATGHPWGRDYAVRFLPEGEGGRQVEMAFRSATRDEIQQLWQLERREIQPTVPAHE